MLPPANNLPASSDARFTLVSYSTASINLCTSRSLRELLSYMLSFSITRPRVLKYATYSRLKRTCHMLRSYDNSQVDRHRRLAGSHWFLQRG
ncbi:hypothetical protein PM082_009837 [Marasmius tenuissimus]|nr:hypothetical protein PM082_009837 [Marasmius tenuissimus]